MIVEPSIAKTRSLIDRWRTSGETIGLVPTMGYFHAGHLALMNQCRQTADRTVVSLFVNPTQFGADEDLDLYPRDFEGDCDKARAAGVDMVFCPEAGAMYGAAHRTIVTVSELTEGLCGVDRPDHFTGVTTVVTKLFNITGPDYAFFGEKDFQQLTVIMRLVNDLNFNIKVVGVGIVRERDGLAMSSRNAYLSASEREEAVVLYRALKTIRDEAVCKRYRDSSALLTSGRALIERSPACTVDYLSIADERTLQPQHTVTDRCRVFGAIKVSGRIRLIDNLALYG
ncbi:MAG: pantoate--beta-alanine ligase [Desulfofustis sp.]|nr:pantoate--beta-alanine ligase [Desulfofustis sp.]